MVDFLKCSTGIVRGEGLSIQTLKCVFFKLGNINGRSETVGLNIRQKEGFDIGQIIFNARRAEGSSRIRNLRQVGISNAVVEARSIRSAPEEGIQNAESYLIISGNPKDLIGGGFVTDGRNVCELGSRDGVCTTLEV